MYNMTYSMRKSLSILKHNGFDKFYDEWEKREQDLKLDAYKEYSKGFNHDFLSATADLKETNSKN